MIDIVNDIELRINNSEILSPELYKNNNLSNEQKEHEGVIKFISKYNKIYFS